MERNSRFTAPEKHGYPSAVLVVAPTPERRRIRPGLLDLILQGERGSLSIWPDSTSRDALATEPLEISVSC
jgi:hypothetical protein